MQSASMTQQPVPMVQPVPMIQQPMSTAQQFGIRKGFANKTITSFGISQIVLGSLAIIFCIVTLSVDCHPVSYVSTGIWTGIFVIVTGILGCVSGYKKNNCTIIANMVLSIIAAVMAGAALLPMSAVGVAVQERCYYYYYDYDTCSSGRYASCVASHSINLIVSIIVGVIAILSACFCCRAVCCKKTQNAMYFVPSAQPGNTAQQVPMVNMASSQGTPVVYMVPSTGMQVIQQAPGVQQYQPMVVSGNNYPQQQQQQQPQPTMMIPQVQFTQQTQPQPIPQGQVNQQTQPQPIPQGQEQQNMGAEKEVDTSSPPPSYSSTAGNEYVADTQTLPLVQ
ncbi:uncharacterized protein LOC100373810 [Saccoglossus kowalevskii]|uniref:Uncharacterized protein LOC100373810 n=1 Tax=Saccoglossus kowalevskii TaxID=10224 RepID=A0ABM0GPS6_SACKO|nr:PREDICTED: uncharacterized protein LOC100373810 [Saccoglossus kowalevskii]